MERDLHRLCEDASISYEHTTAEAPQQNETSERHNYTYELVMARVGFLYPTQPGLGPNLVNLTQIQPNLWVRVGNRANPDLTHKPGLLALPIWSTSIQPGQVNTSVYVTYDQQ